MTHSTDRDQCEVVDCRNLPLTGTICQPCRDGEVLTEAQENIRAVARLALELRPVDHLTGPKRETAPKHQTGQPNNHAAADTLEPLEGAERAVLDVINSSAFLTPHSCWSEDLIAARAGVSRRTVVRAKAGLKAKGYLDWVRQWRPGSKWQHCVYKILAGWHRPHRKTVLKWLDKRRARANVSLNELPPHYAEKETQRSKGRKVRNGWSRPWEGWKHNPPPLRTQLSAVSDDYAKRCGSKTRAIAFATWEPYRPGA